MSKDDFKVAVPLSKRIQYKDTPYWLRLGKSNYIALSTAVGEEFGQNTRLQVLYNVDRQQIKLELAQENQLGYKVIWRNRGWRLGSSLSLLRDGMLQGIYVRDKDMIYERNDSVAE